ncbi:MAG TPA: DUF3168 domain-containing protein [Candidatus Acidoferrum sp.]|nr:DUF3168 domain-containing protein [Candidatus Acidoferrum sp.]
MLAESLQTYLAADTGVRAQLGIATRADKTTGIWPVQAPDEPLVPWIVFQQVSGNPLQESLQGTGRLKTARWRYTAYGSTYKQAKALAQAIIDAVLGMDATMAAGSCEVHGAWLKLELDEAETLPKGTVFASHADFQINYIDLH